MTEDEFIAALRPLATGAASRNLRDDVAVLGDLVLTHDVLVEGIHFRPGDDPADVAWKLVAVNLSDLAAAGAVPVGVLLGYPLGDGTWDQRFLLGLEDVLWKYNVPLLGGDTVKGPRVLGLTALGHSTRVPGRGGARDGDRLWVTGRIGLAGLGLRGEGGAEAAAAYLQPRPRLTEGQALAPVAHAMMDVSDGLLLDAARMAEASRLAVVIALEDVPVAGDPLAAVTAGDDYQLLFALPPAIDPPVPATCIGWFETGAGLTLVHYEKVLPLPGRLGWKH